MKFEINKISNGFLVRNCNMEGPPYAASFFSRTRAGVLKYIAGHLTAEDFDDVLIHRPARFATGQMGGREGLVGSANGVTASAFTQSPPTPTTTTIQAYDVGYGETPGGAPISFRRI